MPDNVDNQTLLIRVKAEDEASDVLKKVSNNLDKFTDEADKIKYLKSQIASFTRQARGASPATKELVKSLNKALGVGKGFKVKSFPNTIKSLNSLKSSIVEDYKTDLQKQTSQESPFFREGLLKKTITDEKTGLSSFYTEEQLKNGKKILRVYKEIKDETGEINEELSKTTQIEPKPVSPKILQNIQGNIISTDTAKGIIKTEEINAQGQKVVRTYHDISNASGQWQGVLKSEITNYKKATPPLSKMQKLLRNLKNLGKGVFKTLGKIFGRIGRIFASIIAFRLASSVITLFVNAFKKGFEAIKKSSDNLVGNFQDFNVATTQISISLATAFIPLIQSLATVLTPLSEKLLNVANYMSATNAVAKGQSEYFELDAQKIREYSESLEEANKQLTQLDKFATLTSKSNYSLGNWKDIQDFDFENVDQDTKKTTKSIENLSNAIKTLVNWLVKLEIDGIASIILLITTIGSLTNPIGLAFNALGALILLFTSSKPIVKALSTAVLALAGAFIALGIAKAFLKNPYNGLIVAGWGATIGIGIAGIASTIGDISRKQNNDDTKPIYNSNISGTGGQALTDGLTSAINSSYSANSIQTGDVYLDNTKVGRVLAPQIDISSKKRNLI